jgi:hypothetical protein
LLERGLEESKEEPKFPGQTHAPLAEIELQASNAEHGTARYFGDYELLEEIARGGMGVVYRARHLKLDRIVAVKMILAGQFATKQIIQRFRGEVTAAALLQHPNIVAIHDVGIHDGQHYFSMDYVEGQNLSQLVGTRPLPSAKAARYVKLIAEAIRYAHQQGILHRDLKPSNVLVDGRFRPVRGRDRRRTIPRHADLVESRLLRHRHFRVRRRAQIEGRLKLTEDASRQATSCVLDGVSKIDRIGLVIEPGKQIFPQRQQNFAWVQIRPVDQTCQPRPVPSAIE